MRKNIVCTLLVLSVLLFMLSLSAYAEVTLRMSWWGSQDRHNRTLEVISMFEEQNPGIKIEPEFLGWDGYWEKIAAQAAGGNLPDIWQQDYAYLFMYANRDLLLDLNPYTENGQLDLSSVDESAISGGVVNSGLYGINLGLNAMLTIYDPELYTEAGVEEPTPDWTWEDYIAKVEKLHDELGIYGDYGLPQVPIHGFQYYLRQYGKDLYNEAGDDLGYEDDKYFIDYFKMDYDLVKKGAFSPVDYRSEVGDSNPELSLIVDKKAAMDSNKFSNQIVALEKGAGRKLKLVTPPKAEDQIQEGLYLKPSQFFSVTKYTEYPEEAVKFIDFFTNNLEANKVLMAERGVPVSSKIRNGLKPYIDDVQQRTFEYIDLAALHSSRISPPNPDGHNQITDLLMRLYEMANYDLISIEEAAQEFRVKANEILSN